MGRTEGQASEPEALIAPGEIRELVARLTAQSVESIPAGEARSLEGVAFETGIPVARLRETLEAIRREERLKVPPAAWVAFALLGGLGIWAVRHTPVDPFLAPAAPPVVKPVPVEPDLSGTVPLTQVTYGPDGGDLRVDPGFEPTKPLPEGISVYASIGKLLWGSGDFHVRAIDGPLSPKDATRVREVVEELLRYVRRDAPRRRLPLDERGIEVQANSYGGFGTARSSWSPSEAGGGFAASDRRAALTLVDSLQARLRWQSGARRQDGP